MKQKVDQGNQLQLALGARYLEALLECPAEQVREMAQTLTEKSVLDAVEGAMDDKPLPNFLHSALCSMSLPVRQPKDSSAPIIRQDGNYSLIIQPLQRMEPVGPNGEFVPVMRGVPYGRLARLVLFFIMTEAVTTRSREVYLGKSFSAWMRRMGISNTSSSGVRGTRSLVQEQVDRLMNCEWTLRWDAKFAVDGSKAKTAKQSGKKGEGDAKATITAFAVNDMKLVNQYAGTRSSEGTFVSHFVLSEAFYENLIEHSVPMNDRAIVALKSATQIDLYTWLAYRLPRIKEGQEVRISWSDLAKHFGNDTSTMGRFRATIREAWDVVSGVYQQAGHSVDMHDLVIRLRHAPSPTAGHIYRQPLANVKELPTKLPKLPARKIEQKGLFETIDVLPALNKPVKPVVRFPMSDHLQFSAPELYDIGRNHGSGNDVSIMAAAFRKKVGAELEGLTGEPLMKRWQQYCEKWPKPA